MILYDKVCQDISESRYKTRRQLMYHTSMTHCPIKVYYSTLYLRGIMLPMLFVWTTVPKYILQLRTYLDISTNKLIRVPSESTSSSESTIVIKILFSRLLCCPYIIPSKLNTTDVFVNKFNDFLRRENG